VQNKGVNINLSAGNNFIAKKLKEKKKTQRKTSFHFDVNSEL